MKISSVIRTFTHFHIHKLLFCMRIAGEALNTSANLYVYSFKVCIHHKGTSIFEFVQCAFVQFSS